MSKEAMRLAIEVFGGGNWHDEIVDADWADKANNAIKVLQEALAEQPAQPAQRTWVGLTESEKSAALYDKDGMTLDYEDYAEAIEAKLKEKNT